MLLKQLIKINIFIKGFISDGINLKGEQTIEYS